MCRLWCGMGVHRGRGDAEGGTTTTSAGGTARTRAGDDEPGSDGRDRTMSTREDDRERGRSTATEAGCRSAMAAVTGIGRARCGGTLVRWCEMVRGGAGARRYGVVWCVGAGGVAPLVLGGERGVWGVVPSRCDRGARCEGHGVRGCEVWRYIDRAPGRRAGPRSRTVWHHRHTSLTPSAHKGGAIGSRRRFCPQCS